MVPTTLLAGTAGAAGGVAFDFGAVALATGSSAFAGGRIASVAVGAVAAAFLPFGDLLGSAASLATTGTRGLGGLRAPIALGANVSRVWVDLPVFFKVATTLTEAGATVDFPPWAATLLATALSAMGAGAAVGAVFLTFASAVSAGFFTAFGCAGFFALDGAATACFSGNGLRALLDGAFAAMAGAFSAPEAVDFAVFFVVNL